MAARASDATRPHTTSPDPCNKAVGAPDVDILKDHMDRLKQLDGRVANCTQLIEDKYELHVK